MGQPILEQTGLLYRMIQCDEVPALAALVLYPIVWLLLLPFRLVGIAVGGALSLVWAIVTLPARLVRAL